ncbi:MAG: YihY/virulence factor BrkB family protein [Nocardioides sp.]
MGDPGPHRRACRSQRARRRATTTTERAARGSRPGRSRALIARGSRIERAGRRFLDHGMTDVAAALTYYGVLSVFPATVAVIGIVGVFGDPAETARTIVGIAGDLAPEPVAETMRTPLESIMSDKGGAGVAVAAGLAGALWSASAYVGGFLRAARIVYGTDRSEPFWKQRLQQLAVTLAEILLAAVVASTAVLSGPVARAVAVPLGWNDATVAWWGVLKWPAVAIAVLAMITLLYFTASRESDNVTDVMRGGLIALVVWVILSAGFGIFVANFGSYDRTYGSLAGVIVSLVWLWMTNCVLLLGLEFNGVVMRTDHDGIGRDSGYIESMRVPMVENQHERRRQ